MGATEKLHKAQAKEYEKVFKVSNQTLSGKMQTLSVAVHPKPLEGGSPLRPELGRRCGDV